MEAAIKVSSLSKSFGNFVAVNSISFEVKEGEIFGFLGPNGAGKTTTQRMLTGILRPSGGTIEIMGYNLSKHPTAAKMIMGVVPEMSNTYIDLSAWENLMLMGRLYQVKKRKRKQKARELLDLFGLLDKKDLKTKVFSKGMKQRLTLAAALMNEPQLLFLDEPTAGLDVQSTRLIRNLIMELNQNGATVFLTTHNIEEANLMCERVAIINNGEIVAIDRPSNLRNAIDSAQSVEIAFNNVIDDLKPLKALGDISEVRKEGDKIRLYTNRPGDVACQLAKYAEMNQLKVLALNTRGPSLEDVFVYLTDS
ncbi:MAG: ATP-binding cassette domain-containing protein [Deltaproteobacteria bacterium]|nr:ATP-binding cassette domain-containing protein [Deltaproteobacteria bacterium]MBW2086021.1 ATP-binding cassette domain-containing protein [Deltaproteobacteria bacterium]